MSSNAINEIHGEPSAWRFIPLEQYSRPPEPAREKVRRGLLGIWDRVRQARTEAQPFLTAEELGLVSEEILDAVAAPPKWEEAIPVLTEALDKWLDGGKPGVRIFVGPPHSGISQILLHWAKARGWRALASPAADQVLEGGHDWLRRLDEDTVPLVIPHLERCYLRHHNGLTLIRRFLDYLSARRRRCLIACNTWAWAYLGWALQASLLFPAPLTLEAFGGPKLARWFQELAGTPGGRQTVFRQPDNGKFVLKPPVAARPEQGEQGPAEAVEVTDFLDRLAAYSYGIPGVSWAIWRSGLQAARQEKASRQDQLTGSNDHRQTFWVRPWHLLKFPEVPAGGTDLLFLLHALLLHGGLQASLLPRLLPLTPTEITEGLHVLHTAGVTEEGPEGWGVTAFGYPAAYQFLNREGYLTPSF